MRDIQCREATGSLRGEERRVKSMTVVSSSRSESRDNFSRFGFDES